MSRLRASVLALALLTAGIAVRPADGQDSDLVYRAMKVASADAHVLQISTRTAAIRVLDSRTWGKTAMTVEEFAAASGAAAVFNGPFFDIDGSPMGLLVVDGKRTQKLRRADWGVFYVDGSGPHVVHTSEYGTPDGVQQAFQVGPRLVVGGEVLGLKPQSARRTALCVQAGGGVLALVTSGSVQASALATWMKEQGCVDALNLDGGPSSQMWVKSGSVAVHEPGGTAVPIAVGVFPGQPASRSEPSGGCGR